MDPPATAPVISTTPVVPVVPATPVPANPVKPTTPVESVKVQEGGEAAVPMGALEREELAEQRALSQFLAQMEGYTPAIPDAVTNFYLRQAGFDCPDEKVVRMISLAAQKFVADIANEALQQQKKNQAVMQLQTKKPLPKDKKYVLTMEDLTYALSQQGINIKKPAYFN